MSQSKTGESYNPEETARRRDEIVRRMIATPPKPHEEMKLGKKERPRAAIDLRALIGSVALLLHGCDRHVLEDLRHRFADLSGSEVGRFFLNFAEPAYWPMDGTDKYVAGLKFRIPGSGEELLAALRAYKRRGYDVRGHGSIPQAEPSAYKGGDRVRRRLRGFTRALRGSATARSPTSSS